MAVDGTYRVTVDALGKRAEGTVTLRTNGSALEGKVNGLGMEADIQDGKVKGDSISGTLEGPTPMGTMRFKVTGTVKGDKIEGKMSAGLVRANFSGTRI